MKVFGCGAARTATGVLLAILGLSTWASDAAAHGGIPRAFGILFQPANPDHIVLRSDIWGFIRSTDGGKTWQWACAELYGGRSLTTDHRNITITPTGRIIVASSFAGLRYTDDLCEWTTVPEFDGQLVADVQTLGNETFVLTSTGTSDAGIRGTLWRSTDDGTTWAAFGKPLPNDYAAATLAFAPSDQRVYLSGAIVNSMGAVERSDDRGGTWTRSSIPTSLPGSTHRIHGVHPTNPDIVFVWVDLPEGLARDEPDELWATGDGGSTWKQVYAATGDLPGFAFSPDGTKVLIGGPVEGLRSASVDDALAQGASAFEKTFDGKIWGLAYQGGSLYAGNDDFAGAKFTFGSSQDDGKTFAKTMNLCDVEFASCGATSMLARMCEPPWSMVGGFDEDYSSNPRCLVAPSTDASVPADGGGGSGSGSGSGGNGSGSGPDDTRKRGHDDGGCSSAQTGGGTTGAGALALLVGLLLAGRTRQRRRRP